MSLRSVLARNLRKLRQERGLSQEELAHGAEVTANYVSSLEREEYAASIDVLERLGGALNVHPAELLRGSDN